MTGATNARLAFRVLNDSSGKKHSVTGEMLQLTLKFVQGGGSPIRFNER